MEIKYQQWRAVGADNLETDTFLHVFSKCMPYKAFFWLLMD